MLSEEQKRKMTEGRERAKRERAAMAQTQEGVETVVEEVPVMPALEGDELPPVVEYEPEPRGLPTPYELFLAALSDEAREILSGEELREAFDTATREAAAERRKKLKATAVEKARSQARASSGLLPAEEVAQREWQERMARRVRWTPILPFVADTGGLVDDGLLIDGRRLFHGQEVETTYGEWLSARSILWNLRQHELDFKGEGRLSSLRRDMTARGITFAGARG